MYSFYSSLPVDELGYYFGNLRGFCSLVSFSPPTSHTIILKYLVSRLFAALIHNACPDRIFQCEDCALCAPFYRRNFQSCFGAMEPLQQSGETCGSISECLKIHKIKYLGLQRKPIILKYG